MYLRLKVKWIKGIHHIESYRRVKLTFAMEEPWIGGQDAATFCVEAFWTSQASRYNIPAKYKTKFITFWKKKEHRMSRKFYGSDATDQNAHIFFIYNLRARSVSSYLLLKRIKSRTIYWLGVLCGSTIH